MIYLDSCALVKVAIAEPESEALRAWLAERGDVPRISSSLSRTEVSRAVMKSRPSGLVHVRRVVGAIRRISVTAEILDVATMIQPATLGSLDAIHLATALSIHDRLTAFVTYDERLTNAAEAAGLPVASPN